MDLGGLRPIAGETGFTGADKRGQRKQAASARETRLDVSLAAPKTASHLVHAACDFHVLRETKTNNSKPSPPLFL